MMANSQPIPPSSKSDRLVAGESEPEPSPNKDNIASSTHPSPASSTNPSSSSTKSVQRFSSPTAVKTFSHTTSKLNTAANGSGVLQGTRKKFDPLATSTPSKTSSNGSGVSQGSKKTFQPLAHSTPGKPKVVTSRDKVITSRDKVITSRDKVMTSRGAGSSQSAVPQLKIPHGPKPITPRNLKLQNPIENVIKPRKFTPESGTMKPVFSNGTVVGKENTAYVYDDIASVTSDISSIISFESPDPTLYSPEPIPVITEPHHVTSSPEPTPASKTSSPEPTSVSKSQSCSNVSVLPSQRIEAFIKESKYLHARTPPSRKQNTTNSSNIARVKKSPSEHILSARATRSDKRESGPPPVASRYSLRKSQSSQNTDSLNTPKTSIPKNLSPHLKYGIFNGAVPEYGLKKSSSTLKVKPNLESERESVGGVRRSRSTVSYRGLRRCSSSLSVNSVGSDNGSEVSLIILHSFYHVCGLS